MARARGRKRTGHLRAAVGQALVGSLAYDWEAMSPTEQERIIAEAQAMTVPQFRARILSPRPPGPDLTVHVQTVLRQIGA